MTSHQTSGAGGSSVQGYFQITGNTLSFLWNSVKLALPFLWEAEVMYGLKKTHTHTHTVGEESNNTTFMKANKCREGRVMASSNMPWAELLPLCNENVWNIRRQMPYKSLIINTVKLIWKAILTHTNESLIVNMVTLIWKSILTPTNGAWETSVLLVMWT